MIKVNELRIGNFILIDGKLVELTKQKFKVGVITLNCIGLEPIPLTEEWLIRFGFEKREGSVADSFYIGINPITKDWMFDIVWLKNMIDYSYEDFPFCRNGHFKIQHVNQLQNLYFALTGEELKLTEK